MCTQVRFNYHSNNSNYYFFLVAKSVFSRAPSNYLLIGLDFMVTSDLSVKFIEANNYPLWPKGNAFLDDMIEQMGVRIIIILL